MIFEKKCLFIDDKSQKIDTFVGGKKWIYFYCERFEVYMEQAVDMGSQYPHLFLCLVDTGSDSIQVGASVSHSAHVYQIL